MKKILSIFFVSLITLYFVCGNVYAFGFLHHSSAKRHIEIPAKFSHLNSFENQESCVEGSDLLKLDFTESFFSLNAQLFTSHNRSLLDRVSIGLRCDVPLYLSNRVFLI